MGNSKNSKNNKTSSGEKLREMFDIPLEFSPEKAQELLLKGKLPPEDIVVDGQARN